MTAFAPKIGGGRHETLQDAEHNSEILRDLRVSKAKAPLRKAGIVHGPHARPEAKLAMMAWLWLCLT